VSSFLRSMRDTAAADFGDPPCDRWEDGYREQIDAMLLLADNDESRLRRAAFNALGQIRPRQIVRVVETGAVLRNIEQRGIDHFGYADGISQPLYLASDFAFTGGTRSATKHGEAINSWDPFEPLERVLVPDPYGTDDECLGSYLVFRKLEQNVRGFRLRERELARELCLGEEACARAGALVVGRFRDGTPVTLAHTASGAPSGANDFTYEGDRRGRRCPLHAHIRKVNPRGEARDPQERERRITRRSIPYGSLEPGGTPDAELSATASSGVGLLFMCFQADIRRQFAFLQRMWCNETDFPQAGLGVDPLMGQSPHAPVVPQSWSSRYDARPDKTFGFGGFVTMKGGEYFFAPSLPFFRRL